MTRHRVGLLGHGIGPSLTPALHRREGERLGLDYRYEIVDLSDVEDVALGAVLDRLEDDGFDAVNVTHPFKQRVLAQVDTTSEVVDRIGSANLVLLGRGARTAHNTDGTGFRAALSTFLGDRPRGSVLQVGAGGAGLATASSLVDMDFAEVVVHDRDPRAAGDLVERFAGRAGPRIRVGEGSLAALAAAADGVVHVTPTGMKEHPGTAVDPDLLREGAWVAEVVYRPLETELVRRSRARGLDVLDGGMMAVGQAVDSMRLITGREPDRERMLAHFLELVAADADADAADAAPGGGVR